MVMKCAEVIRLIKPTQDMAAAAMGFRQAFFDSGEQVINGSELLDQETESYENWQARVEAQASAETADPNWVVTDTFFAVREEDERIVGIIALRHELKGFLRDFGHCGFSVRPDERCKGYAGKMLQLICERARGLGMPSLQLSAEAANLPSNRVILRAGGVFCRSFDYQGEVAHVYTLPL